MRVSPLRKLPGKKKASLHRRMMNKSPQRGIKTSANAKKRDWTEAARRAYAGDEDNAQAPSFLTPRNKRADTAAGAPSAPAFLVAGSTSRRKNKSQQGDVPALDASATVFTASEAVAVNSSGGGGKRRKQRREEEEDPHSAVQEKEAHGGTTSAGTAPSTELFDTYGKGEPTDRLQFGYSPSIASEAIAYHTTIHPNVKRWNRQRQSNYVPACIKRIHTSNRFESDGTTPKELNFDPITDLFKLQVHWRTLAEQHQQWATGAKGGSAGKGATLGVNVRNAEDLLHEFFSGDEKRNEQRCDDGVDATAAAADDDGVEGEVQPPVERSGKKRRK